jgi:Tol biopolymer transport system component
MAPDGPVPQVGLACIVLAAVVSLACRPAAERQPAVEEIARSAEPPSDAGGIPPEDGTGAVSQSPATAIGASGRLVFQSDREGRPKLYELDLATGVVQALTTDQSWRDESPRTSPDGAAVVFSSNRFDPRVFEIAVLDLAGGDVRRLTRFADDPASARNERHAMDPAWGPGGLVYFAWGRSGQEDIYRVPAVGGSPEQVTDTLTRAIMPAVSPDGTRLAYALQSIRRLGAFQIEILDLTTRTVQVVETSGGACRPAWSPDGRRLAYVVLDEEPSALDVVDVASGRTERLFGDPRLWAYYPSFSPDGRFLSFSVSPEHHDGEDWDLALIDLSQPGRFVRLTSGRGNDRLADWR